MGMLALLGAGAGRVIPAFYVKDLFTDSNGVALTSHTPDVGGAWSNLQGTFWIQGNTLQPNNDGDADMAVIDSTVSDGTLLCDVSIVYVDVSDYQSAGLVFRVTDSGNFFLVLTQWDGTNVEVIFYDCQGGSYTQRGSSPVSGTPPGMNSGDLHTLKVVLQGSNITIFMDNAQLLADGSSFNVTATKVGIYLSATGAAGVPSWDNFKVTP